MYELNHFLPAKSTNHDFTEERATEMNCQLNLSVSYKITMLRQQIDTFKYLIW